MIALPTNILGPYTMIIIFTHTTIYKNIINEYKLAYNYNNMPGISAYIIFLDQLQYEILGSRVTIFYIYR